jgi:hypothetical protein
LSAHNSNNSQAYFIAIGSVFECIKLQVSVKSPVKSEVAAKESIFKFKYFAIS